VKTKWLLIVFWGPPNNIKKLILILYAHKQK
jgi:hypothetical protein